MVRMRDDHRLVTAKPQKLAAAPEPGLWQLINRRQHVEGKAMRLICIVFFVGYSAVAVWRFDPAHIDFAVVRLLIALYAAGGILLARRLTFEIARAYAIGVAVMLPLSASYIDGLLGNQLPDAALTAIATFVPLIFLQTARDYLAVNALLVCGNALVLQFAPTPAVPIPTLVVVIGGSMAAGTIAGLNTLIYRARWNYSVDQLERALVIKTEFLNTMSHELRSPLHMMVGYLDMWRDGAEDVTPEFLRERIRDGALELLRMVEDTMNVARLDASKIAIHVEEFSVDALVAELADGVRALPEAKSGVPVKWEVHTGLPAVCQDRLKLKEIVLNLVSNALKFTRRGSVLAVIDRDGDRLRVTVSDTGVGIPREHQMRVFDLFERVEAGDGKHVPGVGLGLYIVKRLVDLMGGTIEVTSEPGVGSRFRVLLPLSMDGAGNESVRAAGTKAQLSAVNGLEAQPHS